MSDHDEPESKYICVAGGPKIADGQVGIYEVAPEHPWVESARGDGSGEHQVTVTKGSKSEGAAWAGRTAGVQEALGRGYLVEVKAPSGLAAPKDGPPEESTQRAAPEPKTTDDDKDDEKKPAAHQAQAQRGNRPN